MLYNFSKCFLFGMVMCSCGTTAMAQQKPSERKMSLELSMIKDIQNNRNKAITHLPPAAAGGPQHISKATNKAPGVPAGGSFRKASQQPIIVPPRRRPK